MKYFVKRMLAGFLAALTLPVFNFPALAAGGMHAEGDITNEGAIPSDVIRVITPTARADMFNFIVDPNDLIRQSNAVRYGGVDFGPGHLFFKNDDDGDISYSMNSDDLKVINKSTCPVNVELTVNASKGGTSFEFARTTDFKNAAGKKITGRAIYLALVNGQRSSPVISVTENSATTHTAKLRGWIEQPDAYEIGWNARENKYDYFLKDGVEDDDLPYTSYHMTGAINSANWDNVGDISFNVTWSLTQEKGPEENPIPDEDTDPTVLVTTAVKAINDVGTMSFDWGWGSKEMARVKEFVYTNTAGKETKVAVSNISDVPTPTATNPVVVNEAQKTIFVMATTAIFRGSAWKIRFEDIDALHTVDIEIDLKRSSVAANPAVTIKTAGKEATLPDQTVTFTFDYGNGDKAMSTVTGFTYLTASGAPQKLALDSPYVSMDLQERTFTITAFRKLFEGSNWKLEFGDDEGGYYAAPFTLRTIAVTNKKPAVTVTEQASAMNENASITYDFGSGRDYMTALYGLQYKGQDGEISTLLTKSQNFVIEDNVITIKMTRPLYAGSDWKLVFVNDDNTNPVYESVTVDLLTTPHAPLPTDTDPSVKVTVPAMDVDDTVQLTADFGYGSFSRSKVVAMTYTNQNGVSKTLVSGESGLTINETSVSFTATRELYLGRDWALTFTGDAGENPYSASFDMKGNGAVEDIDAGPSVLSVDAPANHVGDTVLLTVSFGRGYGIREKITAVKYDRNGVTNVIPASSVNLSVRGTEVSFEAIRTLYAGTNWQLVFTDANNSNEYSAPFTMLGKNPEPILDRDPSLTVQTAAMHLDDTVVLKLDFGEGDFARTNIAGIEYTNIRGKNIVYSSTSVSVTGTTATFTAEKTLYNGSGWKLLFADADGLNIIPVAFELRGEGADPIEADAGVPNVTINEEATQIGSEVNMSINVGGYTDLHVKEMRYVMSGKTVDTAIQLNTENMDDVSLSVTKAIFNASQWRVVFVNDDNSQSAVVPVNLKVPETTYGVVVTVDETIAVQGDTAQFTVDFGESDYTTIRNMLYTMSGKQTDTTVSVTQVSEEPCVLSIVATKAIFNGSNWGLQASTSSGHTMKIPVALKG